MPTPGDIVGPFPEGVDPDSYDRIRRRVLWQLPMGLYLLGTVDAAGERRNLMTLNWLMQVSVRPKQVAISVERSAFSHDLLTDGRRFAISVLTRSERATVRKFVKPAVHDAANRTLNDIAYRTAVTGAPIAGVAAAYLDCEVRQSLDVGSHTLSVGEVVAAGFASESTDLTGRPGVLAEAEPFQVLRMEDTRMSYGG